MNPSPMGSVAAPAADVECALACALLLAACGEEAVVTPPMTTTDSAGVTIVADDYDQPAWTPELAWRLAYQPTLQVGNIPGNSDHQLFHVAHSRRLADGGIAVANTGFGDVRVYDDMGDHVRTVWVGEAEENPPLAVWQTGPDELLLFQRGGTLARLGGEDLLPAEKTLESPVDSLEAPEPIGMFADGTLLFRARYPWDDAATGVGRRRARLLHYAQDGKLLGTIGDFDDDAVLNADRGVYIFAPTAFLAVADSTVWYGDGEFYEVREVARDGRTLRIIRLDRPRSAVLWPDRTAYQSGVIRQLEGTELQAEMQVTLDSSVFADTFPTWDRAVVDDLGNLWLRSYQWVDLGTGKLWSVFAPDGRFLGDVATPSLLEIHQIGDDYVLGGMTDPVGREAVYTYDLIKPGSGPPPASAPPTP